MKQRELFGQDAVVNKNIVQPHEPFCHACGAKTVTYNHRFNNNLFVALHFIGKIRKKFFRARDLDKKLTFNQRTNFQKLKYWNLITQIEEKEIWCLTPFGRSFLKGEEMINKKVSVYRNQVVKHYGPMIHIAEAGDDKQQWNRSEYWEGRDQ